LSGRQGSTLFPEAPWLPLDTLRHMFSKMKTAELSNYSSLYVSIFHSSSPKRCRSTQLDIVLNGYGQKSIETGAGQINTISLYERQFMSISESEKVWVAYNDPDFFGPLSAVEIKKALSEGKLKDDDCIWKKGWDKWKQPKNIPLFSFECKVSSGSGRPIPDIPVPDPNAFLSTISPKISAKELSTTSDWDAKRIMIVAGSTLFAGIPGAAIAGVLTKKSHKEREAEEEKSIKYIDSKNR